MTLKKFFLPHWIEAQGAGIACFELSESPSGWMLVDDSFVISQPSRSYAVKPVVQLTSVLNPALSGPVQVPTWVWQKTLFDGRQLLNFSDCLIVFAKGNRNDSVNSYSGHTSPYFGWGWQLLQVKKWGGEAVKNLQLYLAAHSRFDTVLVIVFLCQTVLSSSLW